MDECDQVAEKINLKVDTTVEHNSTELVAVEAEEEVSALQRHMSAAKIKPLPACFIAGASCTQALNRPIPILGQAVGIFMLVAAWLWAHHFLSLGGSLIYLALPGAVSIALVAVTIAAMKMQAKSWAELFAGAMHPLVIFERKTFLPLSVGALGDALQGSNEYLLAAACYGEIIRVAHPFDAMQTHRGFERELIISLAYAGKFKQSLFYADNLLGNAEYLLSTVNNATTRAYFCFASRTAAMAYELAGEKTRANELRERCFEFIKEFSLKEEARLFGNMAKAEAHCLSGQYDAALPLLLELFQNLEFGHKIASEIVLQSRAYHLLAICYARKGDFDEAWRMHKLGCQKGSSDLSTYVKGEGICAEAEILRLSGQTDQADQLIEKSLKRLRVTPASVLGRRVSAFHSDPSRLSPALHVHDEHDELTSAHDDQPLPVRVLTEDRSVLNRLKRLLAGVGLLTLVAFLVSPGSPGYLLMFIPVFGFGIYSIREKNKTVSDAMTVIKDGTPQLVQVKLWGPKDLTLYRDDGRAIDYTGLGSDHWSKLQSVAGSGKFDAIAYADKEGDIHAVQVLGQYASVTRSRKR